MYEPVLSMGSMARKPTHLDPFNGQVTGLKLNCMIKMFFMNTFQLSLPQRK